MINIIKKTKGVISNPTFKISKVYKTLERIGKMTANATTDKIGVVLMFFIT